MVSSWKVSEIVSGSDKSQNMQKKNSVHEKDCEMIESGSVQQTF